MSYPREIYNLIYNAAKQQDIIGRQGFLDGHVSQLWGIAQERIYRLDPTNRRKGTTWSKRLVTSLYKLSCGMWEHRNNTLYKNRSDTVSQKWRDTILAQVEDELAIGRCGIRRKDITTICFDGDKLRSWTTPALEMWLKHVQKT